MEFISIAIFDIICILFPLSIYIIGIAYFRNYDSNKKELFLEVVLYSSLYLLIKYGNNTTPIYSMILFNIPLLVAYIKNKTRVIIIISIILFIYYYLNTNIYPIYLLSEYVIYFVVYKLISKKVNISIRIIPVFSIIKAFIIAAEMNFIFGNNSNLIINIMFIYCVMLIFTLISYLILFFLNKGEEIMELNNIINELEKEKKLRESLFKITHEIKNPIAVCKGYLDMMDCNDVDKVERYVSIIKDEINRTLILMDDFLDYTKIQIEKDITDLYLLLEETSDIVKPLFRKNKIALELNVPEDEMYMNLDYNRLKQVLVNILKNSIEAKDNSKKKHYVSIDIENNKDKVFIRIKDNGIGMDKNTLDKVDEMFYTTKENGTGLGVALSKEIINQHGGSIKYSSIKNKYTTVTISLPIESY